MSLVSFEQLKKGTGIKQRPKLIKFLNEKKIKYWLVDDENPITTDTALDKALLMDEDDRVPKL